MIAIRPSYEGSAVRSAESAMADVYPLHVWRIAESDTNLPIPTAHTARYVPPFADQVMDFAMTFHYDLLRKLAD